MRQPLVYSSEDEDFARNLRARRIRPSVQFSFDGVGKHDLMRGWKEKKDELLRNIDNI